MIRETPDAIRGVREVIQEARNAIREMREVIRGMQNAIRDFHEFAGQTPAGYLESLQAG